VNCAQILTVAKDRLVRKAGQLDDAKMAEVDAALAVSLGLTAGL
jgi:mRNA-degrading endonuclease toxin of MazEF toxin-antitoxin module